MLQRLTAVSVWYA